MRVLPILTLAVGAQAFMPTTTCQTRHVCVMKQELPAAHKGGVAAWGKSIARLMSQGAALVAPAALAGVMAPPAQEAQAAVVMLPRCEAGRGDGCEAMAEGSEFVRSLQKRSSDNYEATMKKYLRNYNYNNFKDYFAFKGQVLTVRKDGTFVALDKKVYDRLYKEGKVDGPNWLTDEAPPTEGATSAFDMDNKFTPPAYDEAAAK